MELSEIIAELENYTGKFPRQALEEAIAQREAITPLLLENLEKWKDNLEELVELPDYFLHIYAMFLLAQFKESQAYPLIIEFFSAPGEISLDVTGDMVTEDLGRILASVCDGQIEPLKPLIENPEVNEFVRGAALRTLMVLVAQGVMAREVVIEYFEELFREKLEKDLASGRETDYIWSVLVYNSAMLYPQELKPYIERAFESELVDLFLLQPKDIDYYLQLGQEASLKQLREDKYYSLIEDTISDMEGWACFQELKPKKNKHKPLGLGKLNQSAQKKTSQTKKKAKRKMQKQARRKNR